MRLIVCGSRTYANEKRVKEVLDDLKASTLTLVIIQGEQTGADQLAREWAGANAVECDGYKARWTEYGNVAGPIRNQQMIDEGKPDMVVAFPGGVGTANMKKLARKAGIPVAEIADYGG